MKEDIERMIATFEGVIRSKPDYPLRLVRLAAMVDKKGEPLRACELARRALEIGRDDPEVVMHGRKLLASLVPGYHVPMMNDARRNPAWDKALRRAIRPGMHVLEIGTGAGMLAMMAARAGAEKVVTCEVHPVAAAMARELVARNGFADRISVVAKRSQDLIVGVDIDRPADLLFCDIFSDNLLGFEPLASLADARQRLLASGAPVVPATGTLRMALANWLEYGRDTHIDRACGFDLRPFADFTRRSIGIEVGSPNIRLMSRAHDAFCFDFSAASHEHKGRTEFFAEMETGGEVNGIACWIRLELDAETTLEAKPESGAKFFSRSKFYPFVEPLTLRAGDELRLVASYEDESVDAWLAGPG